MRGELEAELEEMSVLPAEVVLLKERKRCPIFEAVEVERSESTSEIARERKITTLTSYSRRAVLIPGSSTCCKVPLTKSERTRR